MSNTTIRESVQRAKNAILNIKNKLSTYVEMPAPTPVEDYPDKINAVYNAGEQSEYDRFWNDFQQNGQRRDYLCAFAGRCWTNNTLQPKYLINPTNASNMFYYCGTSDNWIDFSQLNTDFSECTGLTGTFQNAYVRNIEIDLSSAASLWYTFQCNDGGYLNNITIKITDKCKTFGNTFDNLPYISTLIFTNDSVIAGDGLNLRWSTHLSRESITSIVNALSDTTTGKSIILSRAAINKAFETSENMNDGETSERWAELKESKNNWTINLQ